MFTLSKMDKLKEEFLITTEDVEIDELKTRYFKEFYKHSELKNQFNVLGAKLKNTKKDLNEKIAELNDMKVSLSALEKEKTAN